MHKLGNLFGVSFVLMLSVMACASDKVLMHHHLQSANGIEPSSAILTTPTTWKQMRDHQVVKQNQDFSCGASSLATIMTYFYHIDITEGQLLEEMEANKQLTRQRELEDNEVTMASFHDLAQVSRKHGLIAKGIATNYDSLKKLTIPVIVYLNHRRNDHFSVVRAINEKNVYLSDSSWGNRTLTRQQFEQMWHTREDDELQGKVLLVLPTTEQQKQQANMQFTQIKETQDLLRESPELFREFL